MSEPFNISDIMDRLESEEPATLSALGTPILFTTVFKGGSYKWYNEVGELKDIDLEDFQLPLTTIGQFRRPKTIVKTKVLGAKSTVKEQFGFDDWQIDIFGRMLLDTAHPQAQSAEEQLEKLLEFEGVADAISIVGHEFEIRNINAIVIESMETNRAKGKPGAIDFRLRCSSDEPFELSNLL